MDISNTSTAMALMVGKAMPHTLAGMRAKAALLAGRAPLALANLIYTGKNLITISGSPSIAVKQIGITLTTFVPKLPAGTYQMSFISPSAEATIRASGLRFLLRYEGGGSLSIGFAKFSTGDKYTATFTASSQVDRIQAVLEEGAPVERIIIKEPELYLIGEE